MPQPDSINTDNRPDRRDPHRGRHTHSEPRLSRAAHNAGPTVTASVSAEDRRQWQDSLITLTVAVVAAAASYGHMFEVALLAGEPMWIARAFPITVDGLVLASLRRGPQGRWWLRLGVAVSVAANVLSRYPDLAHEAGPIVSAWPPLALYGTHRLLHRAHRWRGPVTTDAVVTRSSDHEVATTRAVEVPLRTRSRSGGPRAGGRGRAGFSDITSAVTQLEAEGLPVNRSLVAKRVRAAGLSLSNERADRFLAQILADPEGKVA